MGRVVMCASVSVDGFIAGDDDQPGPIFDRLTGGDVPLDDGFPKVSQASRDLTRAHWDSIGVTIAGRRVFDLTDGRGGVPPSGRPRPPREGWDPAAPFHFVDEVAVVVRGERVLHLRHRVRR